MPGVLRHFVLGVHKVHFLVGVIDEHILRAFFHALDGAFARSLVRGLGTTLAIRDIAGPCSVRSHGQRRREEHGSRYHRKSYFHFFLPLENDRPMIGLDRHNVVISAVAVQMNPSYHKAEKGFWILSMKKKEGGFSGTLPPLTLYALLRLFGESFIEPGWYCWQPLLPVPLARSGSPKPSSSLPC